MLYVAQVVQGAVAGLIPLVPVMVGVHAALWRRGRADADGGDAGRSTSRDAMGADAGIRAKAQVVMARDPSGARANAAMHPAGPIPSDPPIAGRRAARRASEAHPPEARPRPSRPTPAHIAGVYAFCFALLLILSVTGVPTVRNFRVEPNVNLAPFQDIQTNAVQYAMNVVLFLPVGFGLPLLWRRFERWWWTIPCGALFSLLIEVGQLFCTRATDIDDLLMNTLGTVIGYALCLCATGRGRRLGGFSLDARGAWRWEPWVCFAAAWVVMVWVQPLLAGWFPAVR